MKIPGLKALAIALSMALSSTANAQTQTETVTNSGLTAEEQLLEPPTPQRSATEDNQPVPVNEADSLVLTPLAQGGYADRKDRLVVDVIENDTAYLAVRIETPNGNPVSGARARASIEGTSIVVDESDGLLATSDRYGIIELAVLGGQMGLDVLTVEVNEESVEVVLNVLSLAAAGIPELPTPEGGISWADLMQANVTYQGNEIAAQFPANIAKRAGQTVRIAGFMTPLQAESSQRWFLLTSNPPHCYFDIPGGPAGAVEVLAPDGVEVSWDPVVIEGRFEPVEISTGSVYRLHDAKVVEP